MKTSILEKVRMVGKETHVIMGAMRVRVKVLDYKYSYGHDRWLVTPAKASGGSGETWVENIELV